MTTRAEAFGESSLARIEDRLRQSLATVQTEAEDRVKSMRRYVANRPVRSVVVAFAVGLGLARLLQKLT